MADDAGSPATDLGRRIAEQRGKAGLSREEAAERAGMSAVYLAYLETSSTPNPTQATLTRLAVALGAQPSALTGAGMDLPPGQGGPARRSALEDLAPDQCQVYIAAGGVGRFLYDDDTRGPVAVPVNYKMDGNDVIFRTGSTQLAAEATSHKNVSFDVDHLDDALGEGWSVLLSGTASVITDSSELAKAHALGIEPWAGGDRDTYIRLVPKQVTGRRIRVIA
jgi:transcriptional regulator with XRE-family HTH domain